MAAVPARFRGGSVAFLREIALFRQNYLVFLVMFTYEFFALQKFIVTQFLVVWLCPPTTHAHLPFSCVFLSLQSVISALLPPRG